LPPALREHVAACAGCLEWARKAARLEATLESLPAPVAPEQKKEAMLGDLMQAEPVIRPLPAFAARPGFGVVAVRFLRRNAAYVGGLAAAVLVAVGIYALLPKKGPEFVAAPPQKYPLLDKMVKRDAELARASTAARKLEVLGGMADDISTETRGMARIAPGSDLRQMAGWYEKTVKEGLVKQANNLPVGMSTAEKSRLLESLAAKLDADAAAAEALSRESPPDAQPALKRVAEAAREGKDSLRAAARGGK
jgi:hypothetical protein